mmetsp:Transcript_17221/g.19932  ORF Transcript_17221/g.19932 Transcript_17221/m.19932 type:complete len:867 (+) Transcript_17221:123-2723(+)
MKRPWSPTERQSLKKNSNTSSIPFASDPPHVMVDGIKFYSDRFYLNAPVGLPKYDDAFHEKNQHMCEKCQGQNSPPPLFDRSRLIKSLDLKAAIVATYTMNPDWISHEMPTLFPPWKGDNSNQGGRGDTLFKNYNCDKNQSDCVPTLILHGHKGLEASVLRQRKERLERLNQLSEKRNIKKMKLDETNYKDTKVNMCDQKESVITIDDSDDEDDDIEVIKCVKTETHDTVTSTNVEMRNGLQPQRIAKKKKKFSMTNLAAKHGMKLFQEPIINDSKKISGESKRKDEDDENSIKQEVDILTETKAINDDRKNKEDIKLFGNSVYVTEILPRFLPPRDPEKMKQEKPRNSDERDVIIIESSDEEEGDLEVGGILTPSIEEKGNDFGVQADIAKRRKSCRGVHHPKFLLLFEKSGSVVVVISTSNLTSPKAADGTWLQRFYPSKQYFNANIEYEKNRCDGSDFGYVLCDFLQRQSDAAEVGKTIPTNFIKKYLGLSSLNEFRRNYRFDKACVNLVSTVPGYHPGRFSTKHLSKISGESEERFDRRIFYGPQRVSDILHRCKLQNWLPSDDAKNDKLIFQTTSFGSHWKNNQFIYLIKQYMALDGDLSCIEDQADDVLKQAHIVWPTKKEMKRIRNNTKANFGDMSDEDPPEDGQHFVFLSTEAFNEIDLSVLSCMTQYEVPKLSPINFSLSPHIKTYARVMHSKKKYVNGFQKMIHKNKKNEDTDLAWVMLTSACLSRGAQGYTVKKNGFEANDERGYTNFELGVIFCSRLEGKSSTDRLYRCYSNTSCDCAETQTWMKNDGKQYFPYIVHLPIPYEMNSKTYQSEPDGDSYQFLEDPYFNEITSKSIVKGNMSLTPCGKKARTKSLE